MPDDKKEIKIPFKVDGRDFEAVGSLKERTPRELTDEVKYQILETAKAILEREGLGASGVGLDETVTQLEKLYCQGYEVDDPTARRDVPLLRFNKETKQWEVMMKGVGTEWDPQDPYLGVRKK